MPGMPFLNQADSYQGVQGEGVPAMSSTPSRASIAFFVWLIVIGVIIPVVILGGLKAGGFQFVYRRR